MPVTFVSLPHRLTLILQIIGFSLMSTRKFTLLLKISLAVETFHSLVQCFFLFSFWMLLFLWKNNDIMALIGILLNLWVILEKTGILRIWFRQFMNMWCVWLVYFSMVPLISWSFPCEDLPLHVLNLFLGITFFLILFGECFYNFL